ncbi:BIG1-domain-containing protein [Ophiobolus disseminans]|uniref:Protein BIG1 n=1 Tax=Ophiobolus disseminans TaxID=1469910 RepID=A0A6A7AGR6_9PLEO|nr:BIG1-domain-containing protein [Ophiobolus disseminans]
MVKTLVGALALAALPSALAFRNTSPFFLFSTANLNLHTTDASVAESSQTTTDVLDALKGCPTKSYLIVEQQGVSSADFVDGRSAPRLSHYMAKKDDQMKTTLAVSDMVGHIDLEAIQSRLESECGYRAEWIQHSAPGPDKAHRTSKLQRADETMESLITKEAARDFTVIYITTPVQESVAKAQLQEDTPPYEMENAFGNFDQLELKRDLSSHVRSANSTSSPGLFERYQYFTPGLFMAFSAIIPLFLILLVGIRALTSLEVSYFAFSKEMGPNAQKK